MHMPTERQPPGYTARFLLLTALGAGVGCPQLLDDDFRASTASPAGTAGSGLGGGADGSGGTGAGAAPAAGASGSAPPVPAGGSAGSAGAAGASGMPSCSEPAIDGPGGRCYLLVSASASWATARSQCRARGTGWDLMSIRSAEDSTFLANLLTTEVWVGADDTDGNEVWRWVDDGTEFWEGGGAGSVVGDAYLNWNPNEPNGGGGHDCMRVLPTAFWADLDCGDGRASVCAGPPPR